MTDIYDIKTNILWTPINIFYSILYILFFIIIVFLLKYLYSKKDVNKKEILIIKEKIDYNKILENIDINISKEKFYKELSFIIKWFLEEEIKKPISKMTFKEIKKIWLEKDIENLIKNIYYKEYQKDFYDNLEIREKIIKDISKIIKQNL